MTAAMRAAGGNHVEALGVLLDADADLEPRLGSGPDHNAFLLSVEAGVDAAILQQMIDAGMDVDVLDAFGDSALSVAAFHNHVEMVEFLIDAGAVE